ncbi:MAG: hypothetical protein AB7E70_12975 [Hyphomicrobiaceae bacterium]
MNTDESLTLLARGKEAWNAWAAEMLAEKARLEAAGEWGEDKAKAWRAAARADFDGHTFEVDVSFEDFVFPGDASFVGANFLRVAAFIAMRVHGDAAFPHAKFADLVTFLNVRFGSGSWFRAVHFEGVA